MKDIRCLFGNHIYAQAEAKVVDERKGYLITRVSMFCTRCGKSYEDMIVIPFPEWLPPDIVRCKNCKHYDTHDHRCKVWNHGVIMMGFCHKGERE